MSSPKTQSEWAHRLGQALVSEGYLPEETVAPLVAEASGGGERLGILLVARGLVGGDVIASVLGKLSEIPAVDITAQQPADDAMAAIPDAAAREYEVVGYKISGDQIAVAFAEPPDADDVKALRELLAREVVPVIADPMAIRRILHVNTQSQASGPADTGGSPAATNVGRAGTIATGTIAAGGIPMLHVDDLLRYAVEIGASDLHLVSGMPPCVRVHGAVRPIEDIGVLENIAVREMIFGILPQAQRERFEAERELDTSHSIPEVGRFRVNVSQQRGTIAVAMRPIPHEIPPFESLGLPDSIRAFAELRQGLVLLTGPTGSGKSTTLASLVDIINRTKPLHIVTIEDPIEFLHDHGRSIVSQREVGDDTNSFAEALRRVLRQDPDVILVGEMRDLETISTALTAAETGHLVFATLHTQDAPQTIDRVIDVFPTNQQSQVRVQLAAALEGVVTQQLILRADGAGRVVCAEVMAGTSAIRNLIRSGKTHQIYSLMQTGAGFGMQTMDQGLATLVRQNVITDAVAFDRCRNEEDLRNHLTTGF